MRTFLFLSLLPLLCLSQQKVTLEDIWQNSTFTAKSTHGFNVLKDGISYADVTKNEDGIALLSRFDLRTGKKLGDLVNGSDLKFQDRLLSLDTYEFSPDENKILLHEKMEQIYRHSPKAFYYVFDLNTKKILQVPASDKQMFPRFSPDSKSLCYVRSNNIYILDLTTGREAAVTTDGEHNKIKNGWADWVYEEEFSKPDYFDWNKNGQYIAFCRFDESRVKEYGLDYYTGDLYPQRYTFKYPKAGEDNSIVTVHIYDTHTALTKTISLGNDSDIYIPRIKWTNDPKVLCIQRLNRLQNKLEYIFANAETGNTRIVVTDESKTYVDISDDLTFVDNEGFIISSEKDGYNHLYMYDLSGKQIRQLTSGKWDVMSFLGYDPKTRLVYYVSTENGAINRDVYCVRIDRKNKKRLSDKEGHTNFTFTRGFKFYISSYSNVKTPPVYELHSIDGALVKVLEDNKALQEKLKSYQLSEKRFVTFKSAGGQPLNGYIVRPASFDSTKKYPVYMYAYNGPGSNLVNNSWSSTDYFWHCLLNQEGYLVVCVDGRGTMGRGRDFKHCTYMQLGKLETEDQLAVARQLGNLPYVDKNRIGFMGWSYGGYMAALMITKGADLIKAAVAVAPVTNWKYYDNIYTERFMRKPSENKSGYEDNSPVNFVKNIKGKFLLIHGSADDNVHMQNSMEMNAAMVKHNIPFEFMLYPNKNHGIYGGLTRMHVYGKILSFVKQNL